MCIDRRCAMSGPFRLSCAKSASWSRSPWWVGPLHLRRLSHLYHLLDQQAGAPSEMLAEPELQALDRVVKTHKRSLLCTVATAPQSCQSMQRAVCLVGALSVFKPSMCSRWCRIPPSPVFYILQPFTPSQQAVALGTPALQGPSYHKIKDGKCRCSTGM